MAKKGGIVIALGGNAISKPGLRGTIQEQYYSTLESMEHVADLVINGFDRILITHGNGPQVGAAILRSEIASKSVYPLPMDIYVADTQGGMGYMIQQVLGNCLRKRGVKLPVVTAVCQVQVDVHDPAFDNPTKPAFGGPDMRTLFVTSTSDTLGNPAANPLDGGLFALETGYAGRPDPLFAG